VDVANGVNRAVYLPSVLGASTLAGVIGTYSYDYPGALVCLFFLCSRAETSHQYDLTARNVMASGYLVAPSADDTGLNACRGNPKCFVPVGFDWRRSAVDNAGRVLDIIDRVLSVTGADRVDVLAHSQGGLIAAAMVQQPRSVGEIYRIVTLGTPFLGAPKLLDILLYAGCLDADCRLAPSVIQQLIKNYPGAAELSPPAVYAIATGRSGIGRLDAVTGLPVGLSFDEARAHIASVLAAPPLSRNMDLLNRGDAFLASVARWSTLDPGVGLVRMVGYDATDTGTNCTAIPCYAQQSVTTPAGTIGGVYIDSHDTWMETGDGTVPLVSANLFNPTRSFDYRGNGRNLYWCGVSHMGLAQSTAVWQAALSYLVGTTDYSADSIGAPCLDGSNGSVSRLRLSP